MLKRLIHLLGRTIRFTPWTQADAETYRQRLNHIR